MLQKLASLFPITEAAGTYKTKDLSGYSQKYKKA